MTGRRTLPAALVVISLMIPAAVGAQTSDERARAQELFERGLAAAQSGDLEAALPLFEESYDLFPHAGTLFNLAYYSDEAGRSAEALAAWRELLDRYGGEISAESRAHAEARIAALEPPLPEPEPEPAPAPEPDPTPEPENEVDVDVEVEDDPGERPGRSFWRSPWTWIVGGLLFAGAGAAIGAGIASQDHLDGETHLP